jgi:hypothetical protein
LTLKGRPPKAAGNVFGEILRQRSWRLEDFVIAYEERFGERLSASSVSYWVLGGKPASRIRRSRIAEFLSEELGPIRKVSPEELFSPNLPPVG